MIYLLDANTLIEAKNRYYGMTICPGYWAWILQSHGVGAVASIAPVGDELRRGNDELASWAKQHQNLFWNVFDTDPRWPGQIPPPLATPNSPRQDRSDYDDSGVMAMRAAASLRR